MPARTIGCSGAIWVGVSGGSWYSLRAVVAAVFLAAFGFLAADVFGFLAVVFFGALAAIIFLIVAADLTSGNASAVSWFWAPGVGVVVHCQALPSNIQASPSSASS